MRCEAMPRPLPPWTRSDTFNPWALKAFFEQRADTLFVVQNQNADSLQDCGTGRAALPVLLSECRLRGLTLGRVLDGFSIESAPQANRH